VQGQPGERGAQAELERALARSHDRDASEREEDRDQEPPQRADLAFEHLMGRERQRGKERSRQQIAACRASCQRDRLDGAEVGHHAQGHDQRLLPHPCAREELHAEQHGDQERAERDQEQHTSLTPDHQALELSARAHALLPARRVGWSVESIEARSLGGAERLEREECEQRRTSEQRAQSELVE
jgi:hypothetical protein